MLLGVVFTGVIAFFGARWVIFIYGTGQISPDLEWPMWVIYLAIPFGSGLMCYRFIQALMLFVRTGQLHSHTLRNDTARGGAAMTFLLIITILLLLLLTSTPISIALGMTVLVFLVGFSSLSFHNIDIISQRLFTGLESFAIMAVPFFVLSGQFLIDGKIAARIITFRQPSGRLDAGRHGDGGGAVLRFFRHDFRLQPGYGDGHRLGDAAGHGQGRLSETFQRRRHHHLRFAGYPDSAVDRDDHLCGIHQRERGQDVHGRDRAGYPACSDLDGTGVRTGQAPSTSR